jgi:hypothetical protein
VDEVHKGNAILTEVDVGLMVVDRSGFGRRAVKKKARVD